MLLTSLLEKGVILEEMGFLLPWGASIKDLSRTLKIPIGQDPTRLEIGSHLVLGGLKMTQMIIGNRDYKERLFNTFYGRVQEYALDHLAEKFDINLQPSLPESTADGNAEMCMRMDAIKISYGTINIRGEGSFENVLEVVYLK